MLLCVGGCNFAVLRAVCDRLRLSACKAIVECLPALQSALTVLDALLDNSFDDYAAIRTDPDLASLRGPELDQLLSK
jgi:hypothetical protein